MPRAAAAVLLFCAALGVQAADATDRPPGWRDKVPVTARHNMITAAHPAAVDAGHAMLARGGSAVDAAIAAALVLNVVEPQGSGIGGGAFMLVHDASRKQLLAYDGRETAPASTRPDQFLDRDGRPLAFIGAVVGGRSVGVPGVVALMEAAHRTHGRLRWAELFTPAIELAERGFAVLPRLARLLAEERHLDQPRAYAYFHTADGRPHAQGDVLSNPSLARTLRTIAAGGATAFYSGAVAQDIVATVNAHPGGRGAMTMDDLAAYRVAVREPVCGSYRGLRVCGMPPPSSGGIALLQMLAMLEPLDLRAMGPASFFATHFLSEAGRLAYADRDAFVADPDFVAVPGGLLDRDYLAERARRIVPNATLGRALPGSPPAGMGAARSVAGASHAGIDFPATSHLSVVDRQGNAVAMSTTIEAAFGSRLMTEGGFLLNNQLTDFSFLPQSAGRAVANRVEPGKRPRSSMSPTIVYDRIGRVSMVLGSAGGSAIINYVAKTLVAVIDWRLDPQAAIALPNVGSRNGPTEIERSTPAAALADKLAALGHEVRLIEQTSGTHAIVRMPRGWIAGADPRRDGTARGD